MPDTCTCTGTQSHLPLTSAGSLCAVEGNGAWLTVTKLQQEQLLHNFRLSSNTGLDFLVKSLEHADVGDKWTFG
jgi:hypothetical protein